MVPKRNRLKYVSPTRARQQNAPAEARARLYALALQRVVVRVPGRKRWLLITQGSHRLLRCF